jgi:hypothetical protein
LAPSLLVSGKKGGILTVADNGLAMAADFGWIVRRGKREYVSHWWSQDWKIEQEENRLSLSGKLYSHSEQESTPFKHAALRGLSFFLGYRLISWLKSILIFKSGGLHFTYQREIVVSRDKTVEVRDKIGGLGPEDTLLRAPRASKRHVASADSFHPEDFFLVGKYKISEERSVEGPSAHIRTIYRITN